MRATAFNTPEHPAGELFDPAPSPTPAPDSSPSPNPNPNPGSNPETKSASYSDDGGNTGSELAKTNDGSHLISAIASVAALAALATVALSAKRRRAKDEG